MYEVWNDDDLKRPPLITLPVADARFARHLQPTINKYLKGSAAPAREFAETAALLSRLMARRKSSFRNLIGFRSVRKLNSATCRLLRVDLNRDLEHFGGALDDDGAAELPSRNCLDHLLVRLLAVYHIHGRVRECCEAAADYFVRMLRMTYFLETNTLLLAVFAKLRSLSADLANRVARLYAQLRPHRAAFPWQGAASSFLPADTKLPDRLDEIRESSAQDPAVKSEEPSSSTPKVSLQLQQHTAVAQQGAHRLHQAIEMGTPIERTPKSGSNQQQQQKFRIDSLASVGAVMKFIASENGARKASPKACLTKDIPAHEWSGAIKLFELRVASKQQHKALSVFLKFLGSKI